MLIAPQQFAVLAESLAMRGIDPSPWMESIGLPSDALTGGSWRPVDDLDAMMRLSIEATEDDGFGLVVATSIGQARQGVLFELVMHAPSVRTVLEDICVFAGLIHDAPEMTVRQVGETCVISFTPLGTSEHGVRFRAEQVMGGVVLLLRYYGAKPGDVVRTAFMHERPHYYERYRGLFGPSDHFGQASYEIVIRASLLDAERPSPTSGAYIVARTRASDELAAVANGQLVGQRVRRLLQSADGMLFTMRDAASELGVSERTLRRQLADENLSFSQLLRDERWLATKRLLRSGEHSLKQVAATLGYESISSFHRSFRQKTGLTPSAWLRNELAGQNETASGQLPEMD